MCNTHVLPMLYFTKSFILECYASWVQDMAVVLSKEERPLAFTSRYISGQNLRKFSYKEELMDILQVIETWRSYLIAPHCYISRWTIVVSSISSNNGCPCMRNINGPQICWVIIMESYMKRVTTMWFHLMLRLRNSNRRVHFLHYTYQS